MSSSYESGGAIAHPESCDRVFQIPYYPNDDFCKRSIQLELRDIRVAHTRVLQYLRYLAGARDPKVVSFDRPFKDVTTEIGLAAET